MGKGDRPKPNRKVLPKGLPELRPIASSKAKHQRDEKGRFAGPQEDVRAVALTARIRHAGKEALTVESPDMRAQRKRFAAPWMGDDMGKVLERMAQDQAELNRLWQVWLSFTGALRTYRKRILGTTGDPASAHMLRVSATRHLDPDEREDVRTDEEKDDDARASWKSWMGRLDRLFGADRALLVQAESGMGKSLWTGRAPTLVGRQTATALQRLADIVERER